MIDELADFIAGWIAGCAGVLVSHPFDTIKVRLQLQGASPNSPFRYKGTVHCLTEIVKKEKVRGLFKGITSPLLGTAAWNAVVFGVYGNVMKILEGNDRIKKPGMNNVLFAGTAVALAQSFIICPMELIKSRLQVQSTAETTIYRGLLDCVKKIYKADGVRGFFLGMNATVIRDIPGFISYFCAYEMICIQISDKGKSQLGPLALLLAGGIAGTISWTLVFPPDVIKTRIQIDNRTKYRGFFDCLFKSFREEKWRLFVRGLAPTVVRAFAMNSAIFSVYTLLMRLHYNSRIQEDIKSMTT